MRFILPSSCGLTVILSKVSLGCLSCFCVVGQTSYLRSSRSYTFQPEKQGVLFNDCDALCSQQQALCGRALLFDRRWLQEVGYRGVVDNSTNSPRRRIHSGTGATFSRAAPQRPWKCRLGTRVPLASGRCGWRAASASKSAGLRRDVADVPVATPQKSETARRKGRGLRTPLGGAGAPLATTPTHPHPLFPFWGFSLVVKWPVAIGNPFTRVLPELAVPSEVQKQFILPLTSVSLSSAGSNTVNRSLAANRAHSRTGQVSVFRRTLSRSTRH